MMTVPYEPRKGKGVLSFPFVEEIKMVAAKPQVGDCNEDLAVKFVNSFLIHKRTWT